MWARTNHIFLLISEHVENAGYTMSPEINEKISRIAEIALKRNGLRVLKVEKAKGLLPYAKEVFHVLSEAYKDLCVFVELADKQIDMYVK